MEKRVSIRDIAKLHVSQQLERKKAILLNLELDTCMRAGKEWIPIPGIFTWEDRKRYEMDQKITLPNGTFTKQFSLPNYFRGENAYVARGRTDSGCRTGILWRWKRMADLYQQFRSGAVTCLLQMG